MANWAVDRLRQRMREEGIGAVIVADPVNVTYLSGCLIGGYISQGNPIGYFLLTEKDAALVVPERLEFRAPGWLRLVPYTDHSAIRDVDVALEATAGFYRAVDIVNGAGTIATELSLLPAAAYQALNECRGIESIVDASPTMRWQRAVKGPGEVEAIRLAVRAADAAFRAVERDIRQGASELDVYGVCVDAISHASGGLAVLEGDFVSGERAEGAGGHPVARLLRPGDPLIVDIYPRLGAYWADVTRTFVVGEPTRAQRERHSLLEEAMAAGERAARPGVPLRELYRAVHGVFEREGLGGRFPHHAGHCVGVRPWEEPAIVPEGKGTLQEGMVFTLEPGLYAPGEGGMRLEDNYVLTTDGPQSLSQYPKRLVTLG